MRLRGRLNASRNMGVRGVHTNLVHLRSRAPLSLAALLLSFLVWLIPPSGSSEAAEFVQQRVITNDEARSVLARAKAALLHGSFDEAIHSTESVCGQGAGAMTLPILQAPHPSSILGVACLNLLGLGLFMKGGEERARGVFRQAQQLAVDR